ncbi:MAG TPA: anthranilate synthase component I [Pirellulales bacterium]|jgi:anthranilate synthase component 1|nr:anthranilate synthase component I [Pirellulales bacterium]
MRHYPDFPLFSKLASDARWIPVYRRLLSDSLTPVSAFHKIDSGSSACLFESVVGGEKVGRYSFLAADPFLEFEALGTRVVITQGGRREEFDSADPLEVLRQRVEEIRPAVLPELPPFTSGAVGYAGYDVIRYSERLPHPPRDDRGLPDLAFAFYDHMVVFDHVNKSTVVVAMARLDSFGGDARAAYADAQSRVDAIVAQLEAPGSELPPADIDAQVEPAKGYRSNFQRAEFQDAVKKCVEYIRAGDIFQVVISQRLEMEIESHPFEIYRTLRVVNPSPFMFYLRSPRVTLVGSSPEIMVRVVDGRITVRPLAGTRRRGANDEEDRRLAEELLADPKERAEHVMLVDLGRNDVGRVARYRSVEVTDVMTIERYSHVMHITSNVSGQLAEGRDAFDALRACLPAGTVSGAPKVRAMEIIDEIEPHRRGPYAGAVGYLDFGGNMDTCIALRTLVVQGNRAYIQAGAGIVADSDPESEYQETLNKARGLLTAVEVTERRTRQNRGPTPKPPAASSAAALAAGSTARAGSRPLASLSWLAIGLTAGLLASMLFLGTVFHYANRPSQYAQPLLDPDTGRLRQSR